MAAARTDSMTGLTNRTGFTELIELQRCLDASAAGRSSRSSISTSTASRRSTIRSATTAATNWSSRSPSRLAAVLPAGSDLRPDRRRRIRGRADRHGRPRCRRGRRLGASSTRSTSRSPSRGFEFHVTAAVGYAVADGTGMTPAEVVRRADLAMYQAKNGAEREAVAYHSTMETGALEKKQIETAPPPRRRERRAQGLLPAGRARERPRDRRRSRRWCAGPRASSARSRRRSSSRSPRRPASSTTSAASSFDRACQDLPRWPGLKMAINVSPVQLRDPNFADDILAIVERYGLSPHRSSWS